jgi:hypothetical protein
MNVKPKGKNPQEIKAWMKAFVEQDSEDTDIHPDIKPVIHIQGVITLAASPLKDLCTAESITSLE